MKKYLFFLVFLAFNFTFSQNSKGKLFIIGGGSRPDFLVDRMIKEAGLKSGETVAIFPHASEEQDSSFYYAKQQFEKRNLKALDCAFKKDEKLSPSKLDSLKTAKLIYIGGGDQVRFMEIINSNPEVKNLLKSAYQNGKMIAGTSAGAAVMSEVMITGNQLKYKDYENTFDNIEIKNVETKQGLGFIKTAVIDQHFVVRSRYNRLLSLIIENPTYKGIGIDEGTAILVKNGSAEVVGRAQVIVFKNPKQSKKLNGDKLGAKGITLDIYLNGEKFKF
ncbi:MAG: cyanophycinase [Cloacibacterium sp.]|jgi:cyanophycinase|nr:cyanophycinase [Cloacibacterium sp.]